MEFTVSGTSTRIRGSLNILKTLKVCKRGSSCPQPKSGELGGERHFHKGEARMLIWVEWGSFHYKALQVRAEKEAKETPGSFLIKRGQRWRPARGSYQNPGRPMSGVNQKAHCGRFSPMWKGKPGEENIVFRGLASLIMEFFMKQHSMSGHDGNV